MSLTSRCGLALALAALTVCLHADDPAPAVKKVASATGKNLLSSDAGTAWKEVESALVPPKPPADWSENKPTDEQKETFRKIMAAGAGLAADKSKEFFTRFKDHPEAARAKGLYRDLLQAAVQMGQIERTTELEALGPDPSRPPAPEPGPFEKKMQSAVAEAQKLQSKGMEVMLGDFEKRLREIQKEFPTRGEIYGALMEIAQMSGGETSTRLIAEIIAAKNAPKEIQEVALGMKRKLDLIGKPVDIQFTATDGRKINLAEMKGKVILIDFWATWCGPCVAEIPNVVAAYEKLNPKGFEIVGISFDEDKDALASFVKKKKMPWAQFFDGAGWKNKFGQSFGINSIPSMWLIDKKGNLRDLEGRTELISKVEKMLAEK
jgi:thiol-disulfide isomerase/thioredoxin